MSSRIVITGIGVVSPLGSDLALFRERLLQGKSGARPLSLFSPASFSTKIAAQVLEDSLEDGGVVPVTKDRKIGFAHRASALAVQDADQYGIPLKDFYPRSSGRLSIGLGLELFSMPDMVRFLAEHFQIPPEETEPLTFLQTPSDICAHQLSKTYSFSKAPFVYVSACAASTDAIGMAFPYLKKNPQDWMLVGGTDSMINPMGVAGFCTIQAMTTRNDSPEKASRPFDRDRDGFLLGEGSAFLVVETLENAQKRGGLSYGELVGYGNSLDAYGISEPHPEGEGAFLAMQRALNSAQIQPQDLVVINAHGTSTPKNDKIEAYAIQRLLGKSQEKVWVHSTKSMIGHLISASGAVETAALLSCSAQGAIHPSINIENLDPSCNLRIPKESEAFQGGYVLKNSFAFGGQNTSLVFYFPPPLRSSSFSRCSF
jgi:3-oxoacyl-[acyl-carrier-protein] synthase II